MKKIYFAMIVGVLAGALLLGTAMVSDTHSLSNKMFSSVCLAGEGDGGEGDM